MNSLSTMNNNTINTNTLTISSLEIAQITGKEHFHVIRDIKAMLNELGGASSFGDTYVHPQNGQSYPCFNLPKRETLILMSGYDITMRAKIIDRWEELETAAQQQAQPVLPNFLDPAAAAIAWASEYSAKQEALQQLSYKEQQVAVLEVKVQEDAPKVEALNRISSTEDTYTIRDAAKYLKVKQKQLTQWLLTNKWIFGTGSSDFRPYAAKEQSKQMILRVSNHNGINTSQVRLTSKGLTLIAQSI